jgi:putative sigma-54 modulation protein
MEMIVKGRHMDVRPDVRTYAEEKIGRVAKILNGMVMSIEVELYSERNPSIDKQQVAEVTVFTKGPTIRAREAATDMKAAIDLVSDKFEVQARKFKTKVLDRRTHRQAAPEALASIEEEEDGLVPEAAIVKTKSIELRPMTRDEAMLQIELLGHDFLLFYEADRGDVELLYRRRDGDYGLLQTSLA